MPIVIPDGKQYEQLVNLSKKQTALTRKLFELSDKNTDERKKIEEEINRYDDQIDNIVYTVYNLSD
jgi:hypothetical protein